MALEETGTGKLLLSVTSTFSWSAADRRAIILAHDEPDEEREIDLIGESQAVPVENEEEDEDEQVDPRVEV